MNYATLIRTYEDKLEQIGEDRENLAYVFRELKEWSSLDFLLHQNQEVSSDDCLLLEKIFMDLSQHLSPQYLTGRAYFRDLQLSVDQRVLIPRPETEELVDLILAENPDTPLSVLDIGTGSGAIAISLKKERPAWQLTASDISSDALSLAQDNASHYQLDITFIVSDVFSQLSGTFDMIVSNPPYIAYEDKDEVGLNVYQSEPHLALFAAEDGYAIYRRIIEEASNYLSEKGKLYFEIGYKQGEGIKALVNTHFPQKQVRVLRDVFGKERMVVVDHGTIS
ncbi:protein-(glutamine-N5) methyltransferase, release factor-specific [Streptococcus dysgalactiae subsp. equisimilis]|uniref:peptide chain release factor N(5)-glutamine methyltransferase n=1 Tax=Streptococcus dysgalactiae TaxID=1334 RepID=UPI000806F276|nr:peptide chain release factor N(5)-glutamine methyltransferase [Streptococcus dysgalactiae]MQA58811.1 peptide chain release factor N(5)-glutamine methyltransferase [Streptococcus dysgalactiae]OBZ00342.1 protein-(glutamine-N5) methyltransferase, release factor-specific [Streptococcus dysgalactiae subsp. equisimilis]OCX00007.1 protein-(glutamine-N5) methyltransferase, release factor-specific [Streptococcus dysgalactiae subsp. equisimilis]QJD61808.1 peptide chain release factor N(5)-glutamine me